MLQRLARWWGCREREPVTDATWAALGQRLPFLARLSVNERTTLRDLTERFLRRKHIIGAGGLEITDDMRAMIAVQACLPIVHLGLDWYRGWYSVIVYPGDFVAPYEWVDEAGVVHEGERALSGEAWPDGPVVLSWEEATAAADGEHAGNVVIHEFAHKLDLLTGEANGSPPLHRHMSAQRWSEVLGEAYQRFCDRLDAGEALPFDEYAAEDAGEFFAVASEAWFIDGERLRRSEPALHEQLTAFYAPRREASGAAPR